MESRLGTVCTGLASGSRQSSASVSTVAGGASVTWSESGAFNEKEKQAEKNAALSHMLFSTFGLDHFPRYLSRWSLDEVEALEEQMAEQLEAVRRQRAAMLEAAAIDAAYTREFVYEDELDLDSVLAPEFARIIRRGGIAKNPGAFLQLRECLWPVCVVLWADRSQSSVANTGLGETVEQEDGEGFVYSFPLLHPDFCARLVKEANAFRSFHSSLQSSLDRSMLKHFGLRWLDESLLKELLKPLATLIFPSMLDGTSLDWCHGYVASYEASAAGSGVTTAAPGLTHADDTSTSMAHPQQRFNDKLNAHTDDSEVTLNVGLVDTFAGGELHFRNIRGAHGKKVIQCAHSQ